MTAASNTSLIKRLQPLTFAIGFLEAPLAVVADAVEKWRRQHHQTVQVAHVEGRLDKVVRMLEPLTTPYRLELYLTTDSNWTARFDNRVQGADPFGPISYLAEQIGCRGLIAAYVPHTVQTRTGREVGIPGAIQFELFAPERREWLNYERSISLVYDNGGWRFDTNGTLQPFEDVEKYKARKLVDRFTPEMLEKYCLALGVRLWDEDFYGPKGVRVQIDDPLPPGSRGYTLHEARQLLGN